MTTQAPPILYKDSAGIHIVVAAGSGSRYGGELPKQFQPLWGRPLLMTTLERLAGATPGARIVLVLAGAMTAAWLDMCRRHGFALPHTVVEGGDSRTGSVRNALASLGPDPKAPWISIHDAARPMVTPSLLKRLAGAIACGSPAAVPAVPVTDSLRLTGPGGVSHAVDRSLYRAVQTPQLFDTDTLLKAYEALGPGVQCSDDATVVEAAGHTVTLVEGDPANIKVTNPGDIDRIEAMCTPSV